MTDRPDDVALRYIAHSQDKLWGKYLATVEDRNDPEQLGRLRLRVPSVFRDAITGWAWPATPFAGPGYGFLFVPQKDDLVWVEFAEGSSDVPLWTGCAWGKPAGQTELPAEALDGYPDVRALRTPSGHLVLFDDRGGKEKIIVRGAEGCDITIDPGAGTITIKAGTVLIESDGQTQELATKTFVTQVYDAHTHATAVGPTATPLPQSTTIPHSLTSVLKAE